MKSYADEFFDKLYKEKSKRSALNFRIVVIVSLLLIALAHVLFGVYQKAGA